MTDSPLPRLSAALADRYRVERELGAGGMATVWLAEDLKHHRKVAIKVLRPELAAVVGAERFLREIELTAALQHPHILPLFDSGDVDGRPYYVMPFVEGESLRDRLVRDGRLPVSDALRIAADVASALTHAHARGIVHRDIKPENILLSGSEALVADFGIALALSRIEGERLTLTGLSLGTPAYMSPEQISGDRPVDGRSDVYALGCVLFEMLAGEPPFPGATAQSIIAQALVSPARHVRALRGEVPAETDAAIARALAKEPGDRFATPTEFIQACTPASRPEAARRRAMLVGAGLALVAAAALAWPLWRRAQVTSARAQLPAIAALAADGRWNEAYARAERAERRLGGDSALAAIMKDVSDRLTITTEPPGAQVWLQQLPGEGGASPDSVLLGTTPIEAHRVARGEYRIHVARDGFAPLDRVVSSAFPRANPRARYEGLLTFALTLLPADSVPAGMIAIPGGRYPIVGPDLPVGLVTELRPFFLDRFEVTNDAYREFLRGGGYARAALWPAGAPVARFVDRTGLPGPRDWVNQELPAGKGAHPVTGVSWFEAHAYCASSGRRLPTLFEWEKAARDGRVTPLGVILPWGFASAATSTSGRANLGGPGTVPVDAHPFGIGPYGTHALAGNVKEWLRNPVPGGFAVAGGSWQDPGYLFSELGALPPETAGPALGFRCARDAAPGAGDQGAHEIRINAPPPAYEPVDDATFRALRAFYRYDRQPANARGITVQETPDWRRERVWIDGVRGDSILLYLYLPKAASPPFQTLVVVQSSGAFFWRPVWQLTEQDVAPHIKAGRAVMAPVLQAMIERPPPSGWQLPPPSSVAFRDQMILHATELRMAMDYLSERSEVDTTKLVYTGLSWGAGSRLALAGVDDRFRAVILVGAGIDERMQPTLPEVANFNFAPRIKVPKLVVNGRQDEEHPWTARGLPLWNLLPEPKELVLIDGAGHHPPVEMRVPPINAFLDRVLGPVRR